MQKNITATFTKEYKNHLFHITGRNFNDHLFHMRHGSNDAEVPMTIPQLKEVGQWMQEIASKLEADEDFNPQLTD